VATSVGAREGEAATMDTWTEHERRSQSVRAGSVHSTITTSIKGRVEYEQTGLQNRVLEGMVNLRFYCNIVCLDGACSIV
jgi:hypothetical protein